MTLKNKSVSKIIAVAIFCILFVAGFCIWDHHNYPLPGKYDSPPPQPQWPRPFSRLALPAHKMAESLRHRRWLRIYLKPFVLEGSEWIYWIQGDLDYVRSPELKAFLSDEVEIGVISFGESGSLKITSNSTAVGFARKGFDSFERPSPDRLILHSKEGSIEFEAERNMNLERFYLTVKQEPGVSLVLTKIKTP